MNAFSLDLPTDNGNIKIQVTNKKPLFILGANGVGKSTLMHRFYQQQMQNAKRIIAHRRSWFTSNGIDITAIQKKDNEGYITNSDSKLESRWKDSFSDKRTSISIFDLISIENQRARNIASAIDKQNIEEASKLAENLGVVSTINELLSISNLNIEISIEVGDLIYASKNSGTKYSIAELSDGERNALLICVDVLIAPQGTLFIIDEPERHLHRSIISPLLSSLFQKRNDCSFVISTHDITLPVDQLETSVLVVRSCEWKGNEILKWNANLIDDTNSIPGDIKLEILGAQQKILFIEGTKTSLDNQIYPLIYPEISVVPLGSCVDVERAVTGIRGTAELHWISAFGLVDADDRTASQIAKLISCGIAATSSYSVESLYYHTFIIKKAIERIAAMSGEDENVLYTNATSKIITSVALHKERLCARLVEKHVKNQINMNAPTHAEIVKKQLFTLNIDIASIVNLEEITFDKMLQNQDIDGIIARYPIRETPVLKNIIEGLKIDKNRYESTVRKLIIEDETVRFFYKKLLLDLTTLIQGIS